MVLDCDKLVRIVSFTAFSSSFSSFFFFFFLGGGGGYIKQNKAEAKWECFPAVRE